MNDIQAQLGHVTGGGFMCSVGEDSVHAESFPSTCSTARRNMDRPDGVEAPKQGQDRPDGMEVPKEPLLYGLINDCVEQLVCNNYGRDKWHEIKEQAGLKDIQDGDFLKSQQYPQNLTYKIVEASTKVLQMSSDDALTAAGEYFVSCYLKHHGYLAMLRSLGKTLRELMCNLDRMHAHLAKGTLPNLAPPCFRVENTDDPETFLLHYWSFRPGLGPMVKGMVRECGKSLFKQEVDVDSVTSIYMERTKVYYVMFQVTHLGDYEGGQEESEEEAEPVEEPVEDASPANTPASGARRESFWGKFTQTLSRRRTRKKSSLTRSFRSIKDVSAWTRRSSAFDSPRVGSAANSPQRRSHAPTNGSEITSLVFMLTDSISKLKCADDVEHFNRNQFSIAQLCALLELKSTAAVDAFVALWRPPFSGDATRVPHSAYLARAFTVAEFPSLTMHRAVTNRLTLPGGVKKVDPFNCPLADQCGREGFLGLRRARRTRPCRLKACFLRDVLQLPVIKAIAFNPNEELFETEECEAVLLAAWSKVRQRYILDALIDAALLAVLTLWSRSEEPWALGMGALFTVAVKELAEELWGLWVMGCNGWLPHYFSVVKLRNWVTLLLMAAFCLMSRGSAPINSQRAVFGGIVVLRWTRLLYMLRAFEALGPKLLPILNTFKSMGSFFMVLLFYIAGFTHAFWALSTRNWFQVIDLSYRLGVMGYDFTLDDDDGSGVLEGGDMDGWLLSWFFLCSALLTIFMMNVVISVLGESYDVEQEKAWVTFLRSRALLCLEYLPRLSKTKRPLKMYRVLQWVWHEAEESQLHCALRLLATLPVCLLYFLLRAVACEWQVFDNLGDSEKSDFAAPYLWYCSATDDFRKKVACSRQSRLLNLKLHTERTVNSLRDHIDRVQHDLNSNMADVSDGMASMLHRMDKLQRALTGADAESEQPPDADGKPRPSDDGSGSPVAQIAKLLHDSPEGAGGYEGEWLRSLCAEGSETGLEWLKVSSLREEERYDMVGGCSSAEHAEPRVWKRRLPSTPEEDRDKAEEEEVGSEHGWNGGFFGSRVWSAAHSTGDPADDDFAPSGRSSRPLSGQFDALPFGRCPAASPSTSQRFLASPGSSQRGLHSPHMASSARCFATGAFASSQRCLGSPTGALQRCPGSPGVKPRPLPASCGQTPRASRPRPRTVGPKELEDLRTVTQAEPKSRRVSGRWMEPTVTEPDLWRLTRGASPGPG